VAQAIRTYMMSFFFIPMEICNQMKIIICRFWWGLENRLKEIAVDKVDHFVYIQEGRGMGFRTFRDFNEAIFAEQTWRLINYPNSLAMCLKEKYYPNCHFLKAHNGHKLNYIRRSINHSKWDY